jgi:hypothetical protein
MKLAKYQEIIEVDSLEELHDHLRFRHETIYGSFWLWHERGTELGIMINGENAYLLFVTADGAPRKSPPLGMRAVEPVTYEGTREGPSFYSTYSGGTESPDEEIEFLADNYEPTPMDRLYTAPLSQAMKAIDDFFESGERSHRIQWHLLELPPPPPPRKPWWCFW